MIIFIVDTGCSGVPDYSIPNTSARRLAVFKSFQSSTVRKTNEDDFTSPSAEFLHSRGNVMKARFDRRPHFLPELFFRNVSRRWRRGKKREPDLLNRSREFAARSRAFFDHAGATFAINRSEIWRK